MRSLRVLCVMEWLLLIAEEFSEWACRRGGAGEPVHVPAAHRRFMQLKLGLSMIQYIL